LEVDDDQTGLVQTAPAGGVVVGVELVVVAVGVTVGLEVDPDGDAVAEAVGVFVAEADGLTVLGGGVVTVGIELAVVAVGVTVGVEADPDGDAVGDVVGDVVVEVDGLTVLGGSVVATSLSTVKVARRTEVLRCDHVRTAVIVCRPSARFAVSKGMADPSLAVPAKSKGAPNSVRTGVLDCDESSR
jgi:hypothetical protein